MKCDDCHDPEPDTVTIVNMPLGSLLVCDRCLGSERWDYWRQIYWPNWPNVPWERSVRGRVWPKSER